MNQMNVSDQDVKDFLYKLSRTAYLLHHAVSDPVHNFQSIKNMLGDLKGEDPDLRYTVWGTQIYVPDSDNPWIIRAWILEQIQDICCDLEMKILEGLK